MSPRSAKRKGKISKRLILAAFITVVIVAVPFCIALHKPTQTVSDFWADPVGWLSQNFGFYYLEAIILSIVNLASSAYILNNRKKLRMSWLVLGIIMGISILTIGFVVCIAPPHSYYLRAQSAFVYNATTNLTTNPIVNLTQVISNVDNATSADPYFKEGLLIQKFFGYSGLSYGLLGIIYGIISMLVTYTGSKCHIHKGNSKNNEIPQTLIQYLGMLSIIISIMIFAASNTAVLSSMRYAFAVLPLLLAVVFLGTGIVATPLDNWSEISSSRGIMLLLASFAIGALFGSLIIPFARSKYIGEPSWGEFYTIFPGIYFFMYSSMITVALLVIVAPNLHIRAKKAKGKSETKKKDRKLKVNRDDVKKDLKKMSTSEVAKKYKISRTYAWRIKTGH